MGQIRKGLVLGSGPPNKPSPGSLGKSSGLWWDRDVPMADMGSEAKHTVYHQLIEGHEIAQKSPLTHPLSPHPTRTRAHTTGRLMATAESRGLGLSDDGVGARPVPSGDGDPEPEQPCGSVSPRAAQTPSHWPVGDATSPQAMAPRWQIPMHDGRPTTGV